MIDDTSYLSIPGHRLGRLGLGCSPLGNTGGPISDLQALDVVNAAWDAGIRYFDTAPYYGLGLSERRLGVALAERDRSEYVVSTKVGRLIMPSDRQSAGRSSRDGLDVPDDRFSVRDYSRDGVLRSIDASLDRLGLDHVDILLVHDPEAPEDAEQALTEAIPTLIELRDEGVVGAVGIGMVAWETPLRATRETDIDVVMIGGRWSLLDVSAAPLLEECAERAVPVVVAAPFNSGLLASARPRASAPFDYRRATQAELARARAMAETCARHGVDLPAAALRFPLRHPAVACVVAGLRDRSQVADATTWLRRPIPDDLWAELVATTS